MTLDLTTIVGDLTYTISQTDFDCDDLGANVINYVITDGSGNQSVVTQQLRLLTILTLLSSIHRRILQSPPIAQTVRLL